MREKDILDGSLEQIIKSSSIENRRRIGAYYTPPGITRILSTWAIRSVDDLVLEPSFGGCGFIDAVKNRLSELGAEDPAEHVYGDYVRFHF